MILLSRDELVELTGYASTRGQRDWLDRHGWVYAMARDGSPRVARAYCLHKLGVPQFADAVAVHAEPNWGAL